TTALGPSRLAQGPGFPVRHPFRAATHPAPGERTPGTSGFPSLGATASKAPECSTWEIIGPPSVPRPILLTIREKGFKYGVLPQDFGNLRARHRLERGEGRSREGVGRGLHAHLARGRTPPPRRDRRWQHQGSPHRGRGDPERRVTGGTQGQQLRD